ncbi:M15 family metallopeptidase [Frisingicoccus sp.]|uniref:M15 family metallopeptidase n=1 Tax=Frisingicoccus sp. TaxID=1918627 RepID=UPI003AB73139
MNKRTVIGLVLCMVLALAGCRGNTAPAKTAEEESQSKMNVVISETAEDTGAETETAAGPKIENLDGLDAGTVISPEDIESGELDNYFVSYTIDDDLFKRIYGLSYKEDCTIPREELRYLKVLHYGYDRQIYVGELMVNAELAGDFLEIFQALYENQYEIEKMLLVDDFGADDNWSIENNNTSAFNYRVSTLDGVTLSNHAFGRAIDINPLHNPYVTYYDWGMDTYFDESIPYMNREDSSLKHMINHEDLCCRLFIEHGFTWGGDWENPKDYQHFEKIE